MLVDRGLQGIVVRNAIVIKSLEIAPILKWTVTLNEFTRCPDCSQAGGGGYLVEVCPRFQMRAVASCISDRCHVAVPELTLHAQLPLIDLPRMNIVGDVGLA